MKQTRYLAILLALLLLLALPLTACGNDELPTTPSAPNTPNTNTPTPTPPTGGGPNAEDTVPEGEPNTDPDADPEADPDLFLATNGYPMDFTVCFTKDSYGFDTATNAILNGSESTTYTFTAADFRDLYSRLDNSDFWQLPTNLTYSHLTGTSAAGALYVLKVSTHDKPSRTCTIDSAAMERLSTNADVSNMTAIVNYFNACLQAYHQNADAQQ